MVDSYRACRQFERFLYGGPASDEPRDDMMRYPRRPSEPVDTSDGKLIAIIHYFPDEERIEVEDMRDKDED